MSPSNDADRLARSLQRMEASLSRVGARAPSAPAVAPRKQSGPALALTSGAVAALTLGVVLAEPALVVAALAMLVLGGLGLFTAVGQNLLRHLPGAARDPTRASIGLGAEVASDAVVEPGASVEMGVDVRAGAIIRSGAVVRMGSTIGERAVIEAGALISWGVDVEEGAVVESEAVVGAGATVAANTRVPRGTRLMPGASFTQARSAGAPAASVPTDPRHARIDAACDRLEADLRQTPAPLREFLGEPRSTVAALRGTCHQLLERERALRGEASPEAFARLEEEKQVIAARAAGSADQAVRRSLEGAVAAIEDQQRQREVLRSTAERLDAESTRLVLTLEAMSAQIVRLNSTSQSTAAQTPVMAGSVNQLRDEIEAVALALESLASTDAELPPPIAEVTAPAEGGELQHGEAAKSGSRSPQA
jgi:acetyltransferase-like isoleucine patch superfamily enzyme